MAGALSQVNDDSTPDDSTSPRQLSSRRRSALDRATQAMIMDLQRTAPLEAQAAAMFGQNPQGSLPGALGAGMEANLRTRIGLTALPFDLRQRSADADLAEARAQQLDLANQINELNFGYMTEPFQPGDLSPAPQAPGNAAPPMQPGSGAPPGAGAPSAGPPGPSGGSGADNFANAEHLPLTPESQASLAALEAQMRRAARFINQSPQARGDYYNILHEMTQVVQNDPLAKNELQKRQTQESANVDLDKQIKMQIAKMGDEAHHEAESQFSAMANAPNSQVDITDPNAINSWIDQRARGIFASRFAILSGQLQRMGLDPRKYLGADTAAPVSAQPVAPPQITQAGAAAPAPAAAGVAPPLSPTGDAPQPGAGDQPLSDQAQLSGSPFGPRQLTADQKIGLNEKQGVAGNDLNIMLQAQKDLEMALELNKNSLAGPLVEQAQFFHRLRDTVKGVVGLDRNDPALKNTALLDSIFSGQTLSTLKNLMKGNPTEAERGYVERIGAVKQLTQQEREVLIERGLELIQPRIAFEQMRMKALNNGQTIDQKDYENWLRTNWPDADKVLK